MMSYIQDLERTIFLHFLNREAFEASGAKRSVEQDQVVLDALLISHCNNLSVNISQMLEYTFGKPELAKTLTDLFNAGVLVTTSHDPNVDTFLTSRLRMYADVSERYPVYFKDTSLVETFDIRQRNQFSMSAVLRRDILDISERDRREPELRLEQKHALDEDWRVFSSRIEDVQLVFGKHRSAAITKASLLKYSNEGAFSGAEANAIARVFSARYFDHYKRHCYAVTCSGLGDGGYLDDMTSFPHYDIPIILEILKAVSWNDMRREMPEFSAQVIDAYGGPSHVAFVCALQCFLGSCAVLAKKKMNIPIDYNENSDFYTSLRASISRIGSSFIFQVLGNGIPPNKSIDDYLAWCTDLLRRAADAASSQSPDFASTWEKLMATADKTKFLVLTATDTEDDALADAFDRAGYKRFGYFNTDGGLLCSRWQLSDGSEIVHARSSAGSLGVAGSEIVTVEAVRVLKPNYVISVGICFGMMPSEAEQTKLGLEQIRKGEQSLGDILYSEKVTDYETVRLTLIGNEKEVRERGLRVPTGGVLLDAARIVRGDYRTGPTKVFSGEIISGLKLVDSQPAIEELRERFPDAIGGEMEATGVVAASTRHGAQWLVVKAICDWGMNKGKKEQALAASNASDFVLKIISVIRSAGRPR